MLERVLRQLTEAEQKRKAEHEDLKKRRLKEPKPTKPPKPTGDPK